MFPYLGHFNLDWDRIDRYCNSGLWFDLGYPRIKNEDDHWRHQKNKQWYNDNNSSVKELWATEQDFFPDSWFYTLGLQKDRYTAKIFWTKPGNFEPPHVDFFPSFIGEYNQKGNLVLEPIQSEITITNGELLVDTSINKSGIWQEDYPQYPIIRSYDRSKVYYDDINILGGVYDRNKFFFDIDPFEIDSLDTYDRTSLSFPGVFNSGDILPIFEQELRVQEDNILGFSILISEDGLPLYVDKGYFQGNNQLSLDKNGLRGEGNFTYLTSITESKDYIFYLDSMNTNALDGGGAMISESLCQLVRS